MLWYLCIYITLHKLNIAMRYTQDEKRNRVIIKDPLFSPAHFLPLVHHLPSELTLCNLFVVIPVRPAAAVMPVIVAWVVLDGLRTWLIFI